MNRLSSNTRRGLYAIRLLAVIVSSSATMTFADDQVTVPLAGKEPASSQPELGPLCDCLLSQVKDCEFAQMVTAVLGGSQMGPGDGWFHPSLTRYGWKWLAERHHIAEDGAIPSGDFQGDEESFQRLDRNGDGTIKADDFDWSNDSPYVRQMSQSSQWFRGIDGSSNGRITRDEWDQYFDRVGGIKGFVTPEDLHAAVVPPPPRGDASQGPSKLVLLKGLFEGELGSPREGPGLNSLAPDFELKTQDGASSIQLSSFREKKPVVLIFGSFT
jgi:hypothetical protein